MIHLQPITLENIATAESVALEVFPHEFHADGFWPLKAYRWSIEEKDPKFRYYLAVEDDWFVGITGHYYEETDPTTTMWLGWFGVIPACRQRGIGQRLLEASENVVRELGATTLKLYSSDDEVSQPAHRLYQRNGYQHVNDGLVDNLPVKYFEKLLNNETLSARVQTR